MGSSEDHIISNPSVVRPTLLYTNSETVIPARVQIQFENTGFPRIRYGAG